jgi:HAD superfamily hydrolase (TIGR01450 family)
VVAEPPDLQRPPERSKAFLLDLDAALISRRQILPGARELLARLGARVAVVSNNAEDTPASLARKLAHFDLQVPTERIVLAGATALDLIAEEQVARHATSRVMVLGGFELRRYGADIGLDITESNPTIVLVARDREFSFARLEVAANAVRRGARLIVANPDLVHPGPDGSIVPETGALLAAVLACTGPVPYETIGKPEPALFLRALARLDARPEDAVMVGDTLGPDGAGALRLGMRFMAVEPARRFAPIAI